MRWLVIRLTRCKVQALNSFSADVQPTTIGYMNLRWANCTWVFSSKCGLLQETEAQDLIEYALLAGFMAVGAAAVVPDIVTSMGAIFITVYNVLLIAVNAN